ncbi:hypothetical protein AVEN_43478-1 [Araneus ventricosus]|uniref:Uncharacterized protein n=1 Tax=Araneus ventricosus TaxID=182803 RepID=A0A4Y2GR80_ARAVE|nr:hypothetical protein AVEN_43478-1 [Araneus ventricosus]
MPSSLAYQMERRAFAPVFDGTPRSLESKAQRVVTSRSRNAFVVAKSRKEKRRKKIVFVYAAPLITQGRCLSESLAWIKGQQRASFFHCAGFLFFLLLFQ